MQWPPLKVLVAKEIMGFPLGFWTGWLEFIVYTYILYLLGIVLLFEKSSIFSVVALIYFLPVLTFVQADMARFIPTHITVYLSGVFRYPVKKTGVYHIIAFSPDGVSFYHRLHQL